MHSDFDFFLERSNTCSLNMYLKFQLQEQHMRAIPESEVKLAAHCLTKHMVQSAAQTALGPHSTKLSRLRPDTIQYQGSNPLLSHRTCWKLCIIFIQHN